MLPWLYQRLYHELAWAYDATSWLVSGGRWRDWQRAALARIVGPRVLEVGCGPGHLLVELAEAGFLVVGAELSPQMWRRAARRLAGIGRPGQVAAADARALPFADASFDSLVYTFPTSVVRDAAFWTEAIRVIRSGGRIVLVEGAASNTRLWPGLLERLWRLLNRDGGADVEPAPTLPFEATMQRIEVPTARGTVSLVVVERK